MVVLVVFGSMRGSPGATCLTAGVAATLPPERPVVVVEADPAGGVIAARAGLVPHPGMASLAARSRGQALTEDVVAPHVQVLPSGAGVIAGPVAGDQAESALAVVAEGLVRFVRARPENEAWLVDVGRLGTGGAAALVSAADGVVVVVRADEEGLRHGAAWIRTVPAVSPRIALVTRQPGFGTEFRPQEISDSLGVTVLGRLLDDAAAARTAFTGPGRAGSRRTGWWRGVAQISEQVDGLSPWVDGDRVTTDLHRRHNEVIERSSDRVRTGEAMARPAWLVGGSSDVGEPGR